MGHCFYVGPFREPFNTIYRDHVHGPLVDAGFTIERADEIYSTDIVVSDIWRGITGAEIVIAEVSGKNPNVMYEIGMAHTVGRPVVVLGQEISDVPFDLRHRRCLVYDYTPNGARRLERDLLATVQAVSA
jgi:hypothetical protein